MHDASEIEDQILRFGVRLGYVPRWTVTPLIKQQSVAEHSYNVAMITKWLLPYHVAGPLNSFGLGALRLALDHDLKEAKYGDIPGPTKKEKDYEGKSQEYVLVKCADMLEGCWFCRGQKALGHDLGIDEMINTMETGFAHAWRHFAWRTEQFGDKPGWTTFVNTFYEVMFPLDAPHPVLEKELF